MSARTGGWGEGGGGWGEKEKRKKRPLSARRPVRPESTTSKAKPTYEHSAWSVLGHTCCQPGRSDVNPLGEPVTPAPHPVWRGPVGGVQSSSLCDWFMERSSAGPFGQTRCGLQLPSHAVCLPLERIEDWTRQEMLCPERAVDDAKNKNKRRTKNNEQPRLIYLSPELYVSKCRDLLSLPSHCVSETKSCQAVSAKV